MRKFTGWPMFSVPPELADAAAEARFDTCSTASNHSGVKVAQLSYTLRFNGLTRSAPWTANLIDAGAVLAEARRARDAGAGLEMVR